MCGLFIIPERYKRASTGFCEGLVRCVEPIRPEQAKRYDDHPWLGTLETHFRTHPDMKEVTVSGLLNVPIGKTAAGRADKATVKDCLQKLGWVHRRTGQQSDRWVLEN